MKWFKHSTNKRMSNDLVSLMDKFGHHAGYSSYFILIELCFSNFQTENEFKVHEKLLRNNLGLNSKKLETFFSLCNELNIFEYKKIDKTYYIKWPELTDLVDEYTRKQIKNKEKRSGQSPDSVQSYKIRLDKIRTDKNRLDYIGAKKIIDAWNNLKLKLYGQSDKEVDLLLISFQYKHKYTIDENLEAFKNYSTIVNSPNSYFSFIWDLPSFLSSSKSLKFYPDQFEYNNFENKFQSTFKENSKKLINPFLED